MGFDCIDGFFGDLRIIGHRRPAVQRATLDRGLLVHWKSSGTGVTKTSYCFQNTLADRDAAGSVNSCSMVTTGGPSCPPHPPLPVGGMTRCRCYGGILV